MNTPESSDYPGRGTDPYRRDPYDPQFATGLHESGSYETGASGATDLLEFPPLPEYLSDAGDVAPGVGDSYSMPDPGVAAYSEAEYPDPRYPQPHPPGSQPSPESPQSGLRVSSTSEATARLLIKLPDAPPQPSTTLRPHAAWEDRGDDALPEGAPGPRRNAAQAAPFAQVAASPARPSALPSELAALTTATLVVPLPRDTRPTPALLTTTLPPSTGALQNAAQLADAFHDTLEQVFGLDLENVSAADVGLDRRADPTAAADDDLPGQWFRDEPAAASAGAVALRESAELGDAEIVEGEFADAGQRPYEYVPGAVPASTFGGPYGVPTQPAVFPGFGANSPEGHDPSRHALALRYLGGIFHNSSGESAYLDPGSPAARALRGPAAPFAPGPFAAPDAPTQQLTKIPAQAAAPALNPARTALATAAPASAGSASGGAATRGSTTAQPRPRHGGAAGDEPAAGRVAKSRADKSRADRHRQAANEAATEETERRGGSRLLTIAAVVAAAFALLYGVALAVASGVFGGSVPRGTVVAGVPIGGLSSAAAEQVLSDRLGAAARAPLPLLVGQTPVNLDPAKSGLTLDVADTVQAAQQNRTNPLVIIPALFGATHQIAPIPSVDAAALGGALDKIAAAYNSPMVEGAITFRSGVPVVTAPKEGRGFSVDGAITAIRNGYLRVSGPLQIPVQPLSPKATPSALQNALETIARPAVSAPISLITGNITTKLTPTQIGDALAITPDATGQMTPHLDGARLRGYLGQNVLAQEQPAVNATFSITGNQPELVPARDGHGFAPAALATALLPALTESAPRTATVPIGPLPATFTTAQAQALDVTDVLGSSTLPVADAPNRFTNVQRATALVAGGVVQPGTTWSFLSTVGAPTTANGFALSAAAQRAGVDPSGGIDTVATAVFDAAFSGGMGDAVHHPHASYVDRYPVGLDAAVVAPGTDLQWTNTSGHPVYIYASYANNSLTVALLGEKAYDDVKVDVSQRTAVVQPTATRGACAQGAQPGFQVDVTRTLLRGGSQAGTEQFHVTYVPQSGQGCSGGGSTSGSGTGAQPSGSSGGTKSGGGSGGGSGAGSPPSSAPSPSPTGILGGLLH
ncbi:VanW family protein [Actinocrinis sp.]|uniref:VanW family protein n=1 Tax=Actinocrinis sp. TaxID=1920516 RepID=UPI002CA97F16|nr:VanW family protein [Actinocrinis sp.]HXR73506.1 VanW family protein [Actinocrinis sp.]